MCLLSNVSNKFGSYEKHDFTSGLNLPRTLITERCPLQLISRLTIDVPKHQQQTSEGKKHHKEI